MQLYIIIFVYFILINLAGFAQMGIDKSRAKKNQWRISEKQLFMAGIAGGALGSWLGMNFFRHKTRHWYFKYGMPLLCIFNGILFFFIIYQLDTINAA